MSRVLAAIALAAFLVAMVVIGFESVTSGDDGGQTTATTTTRQRPKPSKRPTTTPSAARKPHPIELTGAGAYDPEGDQHENDDLAPLAVDHNLSTFWKTEHYLRGFSKSGVGLLLDAGRRRPISKVVVFTDGPGASARIELGNAPTGPFDPASAERKLNGRTAFPLKKGAAGRYVVVWVTALPTPANEAHITEVRAQG